MVVSMIAAVARNGAIGKDGNQPFFIKDDLQHFKQLTLGHPIIMGRKTFEALPKGALPGRRNIVLTRNAAFHAPGAEVVSTPEQALALCAEADEVFIIGGGEIYRLFMPLAQRIYLTEIDAEVPDADTFFPAFSAPLLSSSPGTGLPPHRFAIYAKA